MIDKSFVISDDPIDYIHIERASDDDFLLEPINKKHSTPEVNLHIEKSNTKRSKGHNDNIHKNHRKASGL